MDVILTVVREIIVLRTFMSQRKQGNNRNTDDDVAYILDIFRQEGNIELGIQHRESMTHIGRVQSI